MFDENLQNFLDRNNASSDGIKRLQHLGVETLEQAWNKASDEDNKGTICSTKEKN